MQAFETSIEGMRRVYGSKTSYENHRPGDDEFDNGQIYRMHDKRIHFSFAGGKIHQIQVRDPVLANIWAGAATTRLYRNIATSCGEITRKAPDVLVCAARGLLRAIITEGGFAMQGIFRKAGNQVQQQELFVDALRLAATPTFEVVAKTGLPWFRSKNKAKKEVKRMPQRTTFTPNVVEEEWVEYEGLWAKTNSMTVKAQTTRYLAKDIEINTHKYTCHDCAVVVKRILRLIPESLLTTELYDAFLAARNRDELRALVRQLPAQNFELMRALFEVCSLVVSSSETSKMTADNLCLTIGPNLVKHRQHKSAGGASKGGGGRLDQTSLGKQDTPETKKFLADMMNVGKTMGKMFAILSSEYKYVFDGKAPARVAPKTPKAGSVRSGGASTRASPRPDRKAQRPASLQVNKRQSVRSYALSVENSEERIPTIAEMAQAEDTEPTLSSLIQATQTRGAEGRADTKSDLGGGRAASTASGASPRTARSATTQRATNAVFRFRSPKLAAMDATALGPRRPGAFASWKSENAGSAVQSVDGRAPVGALVEADDAGAGTAAAAQGTGTDAAIITATLEELRRDIKALQQRMMLKKAKSIDGVHQLRDRFGTLRRVIKEFIEYVSRHRDATFNNVKAWADEHKDKFDLDNALWNKIEKSGSSLFRSRTSRYGARIQKCNLNVLESMTTFAHAKMLDKQEEVKRKNQNQKDKPNAQKLYEQGQNYFIGGNGFDQNMLFARECFEKAAAQSHTMALYMLGTMYRRGLGGPSDREAAMQCFYSAQGLGHRMSGYWLGRMLEEDFFKYNKIEDIKTAKRYYLEAAEYSERVIDDGVDANDDPCPPAMVALGYVYENGPKYGTETDIDEAFKWYMQAASLEYAPAMNHIGLLHFNGLLDEDGKALGKGRREGLERRGSSTDRLRGYEGKGHEYDRQSEARLNGLQDSDDEGEAGPRRVETESALKQRATQSRYALAAHWFGKGAELQHAGSHFNLGRLFEGGYGVPVSEQKAIFHYRAAVNNGHVEAQASLGYMLVRMRQYREGLTLLRSAGESGSAEAFFHLGEVYEYGLGMPQSHEISHDYYTRAHSLGYSRATLKKAHLLFSGLGLPGDRPLETETELKKQAFVLYKSAADRGLAEAQNCLGLMYEEGHGVVSDLKAAAHWYARATEGGNVDAMANMANMLEKGRGVKMDTERALKLFRQASKAGSMQAKVRLAMLGNKLSI